MTKTTIKNHNIENRVSVADPSWKSLYKIGAIAALIAALVFRRNLGVAEIPLFTGTALPSSVGGWFTLLHNNPLLGLTLLNVFDIANYVLVGIMLVAVYIVLRQTSKSFAFLSVALSFLGAGVFIVSNSAFPMLSLSNQYSAATSEAQRATMLSAGQAVLANGYNPGAIYQSTGFHLSLLLVAVATLIMSAVMLKSRIFSNIIAYAGISASGLDLVYLVGLTFVPQADVYLLGVSCIATAGLLLMIWHLMVGIKLYQLSRITHVKGGVNV